MFVFFTKYLLAIGATAALVLVIGLTILYRSHNSGVTFIEYFRGTIGREEEEVLTRVQYLIPFSEGGVEADVREQSTLLASPIAALDTFLETRFSLDLFDPRVGYESKHPTFTMIPATRGDGLLRISNETVIDQSDDRRALGYSGQRKVLVDGAGNILVAYRRLYGGYYQIFVSELSEARDGYVLKRTLDPLSLSTLGITQRVPSIALDGKDTLHIVWYGSNEAAYENRRQIYHSSTKHSKNFWEEDSIFTYVEGFDSEFDRWQEHPTLEIANYDDLFVAWEGKDEGHENQQIKFAHSADGGSAWTDWSNVNPDSAYTFSRPALVMTPQDGTLHLFAYSARGTNGSQQIQYSYSRNLGSSWSDWRVVSAGEYDARHISAAVVDGRPLIAYRARRSPDGPSQIVYQQVSPDGESMPAVFAPSDNYQFFPTVVALDGSSKFCVSWIEEDTLSNFPNEDPTDGDIYLGCKEPAAQSTDGIFNITPTGSHLYPNLPHTADPSKVPIVYYDDAEDVIVLRIIDLTA